MSSSTKNYRAPAGVFDPAARPSIIAALDEARSAARRVISARSSRDALALVLIANEWLVRAMTLMRYEAPGPNKRNLAGRIRIIRGDVEKATSEFRRRWLS